jgi:teichuronic acid biosynthesis glycosyltransferase TuaC
MRIAVVTKYFPTSTHPWAGHSAYQTLRLLAARHDLQVFYPEARYPRLLEPLSQTHSRLDPAFQVPGIEVRYLPYPALPVISRPFNGGNITRTLLQELRAYRPEIILSYVVYPDGYAAVRLGQKLGIPAVLTAIGSDLNRISDRLSARRAAYALRHATWTTTVSADLLQTALRMGADTARSTAILNGCDTTIFFPGDRMQARHKLEVEPDAELVLYVGRLDLRKGLAELIEAAAELRARRPKLRTCLVGDGFDEPQLREQVQCRGLDQVVRFVPPCATQGVAQWMAAADIVTLPSYNEGCPNVVVEALAAGRPVVATRVGGIPELMDNRSGRLVQPRDAQALACGLDEALMVRWDCAELARRHSRSWTDVAADLESVLLRALTGVVR